MMSILDDLIEQEKQPAPSPNVAPMDVQDVSSGPEKENILDKLLQENPQSYHQAAQPQEGAFSDIAKSAAIGAPKGIIGAAGMPGDIASMFPHTTPEQVPRLTDEQAKAAAWSGYVPGMEVPANLPTSRDIQTQVEKVTGPFYQPQTSPGKFAERTTEFLANPLTYIGGAPVAVKAGTAAAAAIGSEAAGQATEGLGPLETAARITGGLIGGHLPNAVNKSITRSALRNAATTDDLFNGSGHLYENSYNSGVQVKNTTGRDWAYDITSDLRKEGFRPYTPATEAAFRVIGELGETFNNQGNLGIPEIDTIRKGLNKIAGGSDREAKAIARYGISKIDENVSNLANNPQWLATGHQNAEQVSKDITSARAMYAAAMRSNMLEDAFDSAMEKATRRAGSTGKGGNIENTMRQEIRSIINSSVKRRGFNDDEISKMESIVKGEKGGNLLRGIGALAPTGIVSGTLGLELGHLLFGGTKAMLGVPAVGLAAKWIGEAQTRKAIEDVAARTRMRGMAGPEFQEYTPATGYRAPLFSSTLGTNQYRGGAIERSLKMAKKYRKK